MIKVLVGVRTPWMPLGLWAALALFALSLLNAGGAATTFASAPVVAGGKALVTNTDGDAIRVREGAGTEFDQIGVAYEGQTVAVLAGPRDDKKGKPWFKVQAPTATGWMMAEFLRGAGSTSTGSELKGSAQVANTNGDSLRMRSAPSVDASVIALLDPGETVTIQTGPVTDDTHIAWYMIKARGLVGWAMAQYLVQATAAPQAEKKSAPQDKQAAEPESAATKKPSEEAVKSPPVARSTSSNPTSTLAQYRQWMEEARQMYPYKQTVDKMWSVMMCESGGNARASGGGGRWLGLFQYAPATWGGSWNPYRSNSIWDPRSQIFATAKAWSIGMQSHWSCYYSTPGR